MTKTELRNYRDLTREVQQIKDHLMTMEASLDSPGGQKFSRTPTGPDQEKTMDTLVEEHQRLLSLYRGKLIQLKREMADIEDAIGDLSDPKERMLLRYRYLDGYDWQMISHKMFYARSQLYRIHGDALQHLRK